MTAKLCPHGLTIDDARHAGAGTTPLYAGALHYFRLPKSAWQPALESLASLGVRFVDTVVPWGVHEKAPSVFDFGEDNPRLDVVGFVELAARAGLRSIVRLGPLLDAQLSFGGIPERVVWDEACMARTASGAPLVAASLPVAHPVPSRASRAFHAQAAVFLRAAAERLADVAAPGGPLPVVFIGDETNRGVAASPITAGDYHPDAVVQYRRFLKHRYGALGALRHAHRDAAIASFEAVEPPRGAPDPDRLGAHLDWAEMQEASVEAALYRYQAVLERHGLANVARIYEEPAWRFQPASDPFRIDRIIGTASFECRAEASEAGRRDVVRQVTQAAEHAAGRKTLAFVSKARAGFPADGAPRREDDDLFVAMTALAYGARGMSLQMAVQRDRWIGGPIDVRGRARPSAARWRALFAGLERVRHAELVRTTAVKIALPRNLGRLARLAGPGSVLEGRFFGTDDAEPALGGDLAGGALSETESFVVTLEGVLDRARIPYAFVSAESIERSLGDAVWTIVVCAGALAPNLIAAIGHHAALSGAISVGPRAPERDALFAPISARLPALENPAVPLVLPRGPSTLEELVATTATDLGIAPLPAEPAVVRTTLHVDGAGRPQALFVINASDESVDATVAAPGAASACDAVTGDDVSVTHERVSLSVGPRTVRLLALDSTL